MTPLIRKIHLWIGLPAGGLFLIISLSGALYCWAPEIATIIYKEKVEQQEKPFVSVATIRQTVKQSLPNGDFRTVYYRGPKRAIQVLLYAPGSYYHANINPYTGKLIHLQDMNEGWLNKLKHLHRNLLLGEIGREVVHWGTLLFFIMIASGILLWWPANRILLKKRVGISFNTTSNKILNYELHNKLGFYTSLVLIFVIATGLFWGFSAIRDSIRKASGENMIKYTTPLSEMSQTNSNEDPFLLMEKLAIRFRNEFPNHNIRVHNPHKSDDAIQVSVIEKAQLVPIVDHLYFDRYTLERIHGNFKYGLQEDRSLYNRIDELVYDVHFGSVLGLTGRLIVFIASLLATALPITGFFIWWNKINWSSNKRNSN